MKHLQLPPNAALLVESMRAIGYDAAAAVADLVDNSISANARSVSIRFDPGSPRALAIVDNGIGMDDSALMVAMRHGSQSPTEHRDAGDLGRFGLGLKTASMSQCRRLTVVSKKDGRDICGMVWDLDVVLSTQDWTVGVLDAEDISHVPFVNELLAHPSGTLVVWEGLDRLGDGDTGNGAVLAERMRHVGNHLALVFHRYLSRTPAPVRIDINLEQIVPVDPFLETEGSLAGAEERIPILGHHVVLRAFTLPHISRLTRAQIEKAGGDAGLRRQQGFYVYRNERLIIWGTWFRMFRQEELTKSTRVRVDVPNSLDHLWSLDIKKSAASPPAMIRDRLRDLVPALVVPSREANRFRGRPARAQGISAIWQRVDDRDGLRYELNMEHPLIVGLRDTTADDSWNDVVNVLRAVASTLPLEAIYNDRADDRLGFKRESPPPREVVDQLVELAHQMVEAFDGQREEQLRLIAGLGSIEPFALYPSLTERIQARLRTP